MLLLIWGPAGLQAVRYERPCVRQTIAGVPRGGGRHAHMPRKYATIFQNRFPLMGFQRVVLTTPSSTPSICVNVRLALLEANWQRGNHAKIRSVTSDAELGGDTEHGVIPQKGVESHIDAAQ